MRWSVALLWKFSCIVSVSTTTTIDLTKTEFLEFYVAGSQSVSLVVDLGTVSEDAFFIDDDGNTTGVRSDGRAWGLGRLDQDADPRLGEIWSDARDALGVWGEVPSYDDDGSGHAGR